MISIYLLFTLGILCSLGIMYQTSAAITNVRSLQDLMHDLLYFLETISLLLDQNFGYYFLIALGLERENVSDCAIPRTDIPPS